MVAEADDELRRDYREQVARLWDEVTAFCDRRDVRTPVLQYQIRGLASGYLDRIPGIWLYGGSSLRGPTPGLVWPGYEFIGLVQPGILVCAVDRAGPVWRRDVPALPAGCPWTNVEQYLLYVSGDVQRLHWRAVSEDHSVFDIEHHAGGPTVVNGEDVRRAVAERLVWVDRRMG
jgi:hypothetical protein